MELRYKFAVLFFITSKLYIRVAVIMLCKKYISPMNNVTKGEGVISIFFQHKEKSSQLQIIVLHLLQNYSHRSKERSHGNSINLLITSTIK